MERRRLSDEEARAKARRLLNEYDDWHGRCMAYFILAASPLVRYKIPYMYYRLPKSRHPEGRICLN